MTYHTALMCALVCWAACSWRPGSLLLAASWLIAEYVSLDARQVLPVALNAVLDPVVMGAVIAWRSSWLDWTIAGIFPVQWSLYAALPATAETWWLLWLLVAAQMLLAGPWKAFARSRGAFARGSVRATESARG